MAFAAEIGEDGTVIRVIVVPDGEPDIPAYCIDLIGRGTWIETAETGADILRFAGPGFILDEGLGVFIEPTINASWILDGETLEFIPPIPIPSDPPPGTYFEWDESIVNWTISLPVES